MQMKKNKKSLMGMVLSMDALRGYTQSDDNMHCYLPHF